MASFFLTDPLGPVGGGALDEVVDDEWDDANGGYDEDFESIQVHLHLTLSSLLCMPNGARLAQDQGSLAWDS